jgi:hypothetical protein
MRLFVGLLVAGVAVCACSRAETTPVSRVPLSLTSGAPGDRPGGAVGTAGTATPSAPAITTPRPAAEVTVPAGTHLPIVLDTPVGSDSRVEQPVTAHLARAIVVNGRTVLRQGSRVNGIVTDAQRSGKVKGRAHVAVRFDSIVPKGEDERYQIRTGSVGRTAPATKKKDALEIGAPAAGGALIGGLIGGQKGALIGTAAGGGAGTAVVLSTRGKEVRLGKGAAMMLRLAEPLTVRVKS